MVIFETERLVIRRWEADDAADALEMYSNPEVLRFLPRRANDALSLESQKASIERANAKYAAINDGTGYWAIEEKASRRVIGASILQRLPTHAHTEVGWHQNPMFWGKGYATEAGQGALHYGFTSLALPYIVAIVVPDNARSIAVAERLGMKYQGMIREYDLDVNLYRIERT